jgi:hypothetical protein
MKPVAIAAGAVVAFGLAAAAQSASAAPAAPYGGQLIRADYACGPGWHVDVWGQCVPNYYGGLYLYGGPYHGWYGRGGYGWGHGGFGRGAGWGGRGGWGGHAGGHGGRR